MVSLASGRVIEINAKLGDTVTEGQLLLRVQSADISGAFSDYRQALADRETPRAGAAGPRQSSAGKRRHRAKRLRKWRQNAAAKAGGHPSKPPLQNICACWACGQGPSRARSSTSSRRSPASSPTSRSRRAVRRSRALGAPANPFTISDLSRVWIVCDVYENDLRNVRMDELADVRLNAYPDRVFSARVSNIGSSLDPALRTAKVRLEVDNPGTMRFGMCGVFVTATFHGADKSRDTPPCHCLRGSASSRSRLGLHAGQSRTLSAACEVTGGKMWLAGQHAGESAPASRRRTKVVGRTP